MLHTPKIVESMLNWFIPKTAVKGRTEWELASTFVFTHIFGPLIAQPMTIYLYAVSPVVELPLIVMGTLICSFWTLPFVLRWTGSIQIAAFASFQLLVGASLFGSYHYGGFSSPFLPWLIVSLLLGLFYLSKRAGVVLGLFSANLAVFFTIVALHGLPDRVPIDDLRVIGWLSITAATIYMTWMALCYARIIGLRTELELEIKRQRATAFELEKARTVAEETSRARARFFSKMSHELRTPLNAIIGYSDILLEDCAEAGPASAQRVKDITRINAAGRHLLSLVSEVLDANRIATGMTHIDARAFQLGELVDEVAATATPVIEGNGNTFVVSCTDRRDWLRTDDKKLRQILLNLLSNAGKFTRNGTVTFDLAIEPVDGTDRLVARVSDTGIGIASEALPRLFQDFQQADPTVFERFGGTGIGLALSRRLALLLGGDIAVESREGQGSCFTVTLPAQLPDPRVARDTDRGAHTPALATS